LYRATWAGCGMHIEQALAGVADKDRCHCGKGEASNKPGAFASKPATTR